MRLRQAFEELGGTAVKLGQQLALRADVLPFEVASELLLLTDSVPPFPTPQAVARVEAVTGRPLGETFEAFDPRPIGAASVACVFLGRLHGGQRVAVKVRRPGVAEDFAADLQVFDWLTLLTEWFTFVRPGQFAALRTDLRAMLFEELDFVQEARFQRLFRRYARQDRLEWVTAPRVFAHLSGDDVLTSEFVEGVSCLEVLAAFELKDEAALARLRAQDIDTDDVADRIMRLSYWGKYEAPFFHGDPHPGNIIVEPGGRLVMLDFGACVTVGARNRANLWVLQERLVLDDPTHASELAVAEMSPLPRIDLSQIRSEAHQVLARLLLSVRDEEAEWWEKSTAGMWLAFLKTAREQNLTVNLDTLRQVRMSLLYDTLALRLAPHGDFRAFERYLRGLDERRARRLGAQRLQWVWPMTHLARALAGMQGQLGRLTRLQHTWNLAVGRAAFTVRTLVSHGLTAAGVAGAAVLGGALGGGADQELAPLVAGSLAHPATHVALLLVGLHAARRLQQRLDDVR